MVHDRARGVDVRTRVERAERYLGFPAGRADDRTHLGLRVANEHQDGFIRAEVRGKVAPKLTCRVKRQAGPALTPPLASEGEDCIRPLVSEPVDRDAHRVFVDGREIELTVLEFKLLETFMARVGRVQTREQLLRDVWEMTGEVQTRTVDTHVKRLREKLLGGRDLIETVRGLGYRMSDPAEQ